MITLFLLPVLLLILYGYWTRNHDYWAKRNVKHDRPLPFFGNHLFNILLRRSRPDGVIYLYNKYKDEKIVGYYNGNKLELIIRDPGILKRICNRDYEYFSGRELMGNIHKDPMLHDIFSLKGEEWRATRRRLSSAFSPSKLRNVFPTLLQCTDKLEDTVQIMSNQKEIKTFDLMTCYTSELIGSVCFGVDLNAINSQHSDFVKLSQNASTRTKLQVFLMVAAELLPETLINPNVNQGMENVLYNMIKRILEERECRPSGMNDVLDFMLKMEFDAQQRSSVDRKIDSDFLTMQLLSVLFEGYETTAFSISYTLHQLAHHPQIQEKVQREIDLVMSSYYGKLTYDSISQMPYLEMAWKESMRLCSPIAGVSRLCGNTYTIPGTNVTIGPGVRVIFPMQALALDPDYFDDPKEFLPERFAPAAKVKFGLAYSVFGDGYTKCIGMHLAEVMSLSALAVVLHRFSVTPGPSSKRQPMRKNSPTLVQGVEDGLPLRFIPRTDRVPKSS